MGSLRILRDTAAGVAILAGLYYLLNPEKKELDEAARRRLGGSYIGLSAGVVHYALEGPADGQVVVLLHGGFTPGITWNEYTPALTHAGLRTLVYDVYGRGYSDRPHVTYDRALYRQQLVELLDSLNLSAPVDLVGYCFGGATAVDYAVCYPDRVRRIALIAPLIHDFSLLPLFRRPVVGEFLARVAEWREALNVLSSPMRATKWGQERARVLFDQTTYKGFQQALLSMLRSDAAADYIDCYGALGNQVHPVLLIRGSRDPEIRAEAVAQVRALIPRAEFHLIPDATHDVVFENAAQVRPLLLQFLTRNAPNPKPPNDDSLI